jgi:hypothetical protein
MSGAMRGLEIAYEGGIAVRATREDEAHFLGKGLRKTIR